MALIELSQLQKHYRMGDETVRALDGVDLQIDSGEFIAILGPSGSGKSTLMHILGFMDSPSGGQMRFEGEEVSRIRPKKQAWYRSNRIGFIFQAFNLLPRMSVLDNVLLPITYARRKVPDRKEKALAVLERVGMAHRSKHVPNQLSGGERQRVAIARALINNPRLILADEPTGNLDSRNVTRAMQLFSELADEGQTLVMVTHDHNVANYARRVIHVMDGKIVEETYNHG